MQIKTRYQAERLLRTGSGCPLTCQKCDVAWGVMLRAHGRLPRGWRKCPRCGFVNWESKVKKIASILNIDEWLDTLNRFEEFVNERGHLPRRYIPGEDELAGWYFRQVRAAELGRLSDDRFNKLSDLATDIVERIHSNRLPEQDALSRRDLAKKAKMINEVMSMTDSDRASFLGRLARMTDAEKTEHFRKLDEMTDEERTAYFQTLKTTEVAIGQSAGRLA